MLYFIKTFGCQANEADSERISSYLKQKGYKKTDKISRADCVVINTCMVRKTAEDRVYGLVNNLSKNKKTKKIIITGCLTGMAFRDKTGKFLARLKKIFPDNVEFMAIDEIGFNIEPERKDKNKALVPISFGCNNYCSFCVVPYSRGKEKSRPYKEIIQEIKQLASKGYQEIFLLGMNVNSYGADLVKTNIGFKLPSGKIVKPVLIKHLGKERIPSLFPYLLEDIAQIDNIKHIDFMSSNPWDFSKKLVDTISKHPNITRNIHLAVQSGSNSLLKKMNRWYTKKEYLKLLKNIRDKIPGVNISTDIIVGFCGETEKDFQETLDLVKKANFSKAYISIYSDRPMSFAHQNLKDDVLFKIKKQRRQILENLINKPNLKFKNKF